MAAKRKYPRLRNGFGSIRKLSGKRSRPYAVFAPSKEKNKKGQPIYDKALTYTTTWNDAFSVLVMYHAGTWKPLEPIPTAIPTNLNKPTIEILVNEIMNKLAPAYSDDTSITFGEVYEHFFTYKFNNTKKNYSKSSMTSFKAGFKNCKAIHNKPIANLKYSDLQSIIDNSKLKHASKELIVLVIKQVFKYALLNEYIEKDYSQFLSIKTADDDENGVPFSNDDLKILWKNKYNHIAEMLLIMIYSGFRINEYKNLEINFEEKYFLGGSKTKAGKNRIVPIHSAIIPLVANRLKKYNALLYLSPNKFRKIMYKFLGDIKIEKHTPHDTRHTFAKLCDEYYVNENDKKRMLGHAFSDITNSIYGHRDVEALRKEIEKISVDFII